MLNAHEVDPSYESTSFPLLLLSRSTKIPNNLFSTDNKTLFGLSDTCTALPEDIPNLRTNIVLPVNHGTSVEVKCEVGYTLSGSNLITCTKDKNWEYAADSPQCTIARFLKKRSILLVRPEYRTLS